MKAMSRWIVLFVMLCSMPLVFAAGANAQRDDDHRDDRRDDRRHDEWRKYRGTYERHHNVREGTVTEVLSLLPEGRAQMVATFPRRGDVRSNGSWSVRDGNVTVTLNGPRGTKVTTYNLRGRNLNLVGDSHIFFKKQ